MRLLDQQKGRGLCQQPPLFLPARDQGLGFHDLQLSRFRIDSSEDGGASAFASHVGPEGVQVSAVHVEKV